MILTDKGLFFVQSLFLFLLFVPFSGAVQAKNNIKIASVINGQPNFELSPKIRHPERAEKRVALVIGNSKYEHTSFLKNPKNDAIAISATLKSLDFEVVEGVNLSKAAFDKLVRSFARKLRNADVGLFYYAGHGLQVAGENYLVPVDAELSDESDLDFAVVKLNTIMHHMTKKTKTNLIFIDACRDNPLARGFQLSLSKKRGFILRGGLAPVKLKSGTGTLIAFATEPNNVAYDGESDNSPFTSAILQRIQTPGLDIAPFMRNVRKDVIRETQGKQIPWNHSSLTSSFVFKQGTIFERLGQPVGRLAIKTDKRRQYCTAFLISNDYVITSHHCTSGLLDPSTGKSQSIKAMVITFGYTRVRTKGAGMFDVDIVPIEKDKILDYAIHRVNGSPSRKYGILDIDSSEPGEGYPFWVIGHPGGFPRRISRGKCYCLSPCISEGKIRYSCDTLAGSSGSPVIDLTKQTAIGIHHASSSFQGVNYGIPFSKIILKSNILKKILYGNTP